MTSPEPLPLVTATFTTDELAKISAGMMLLRRRWVHEILDGNPIAGQIAQECSDLINRIAGLVAEDQGRALLNDYIKRSMEKPKES